MARADELNKFYIKLFQMNRMNLALAVSITVPVLLLLPSLCESFGQAVDTSLRYENPVYGIEVAYPSTWKVEEKDYKGGDFVTNIVSFIAPFEAEKKHKSLEGMQSITFGILHYPQVYSLDYIANSFLDNERLTRPHDRTDNVETRGVFFDGKPAMKLIFHHEINNQDFKRIILGFVNGSDVYYAGYRMKDKNFDKFLPIFDGMVESYNLTSPRNPE
jgi:hypothetical protein